jgi:fructokinase
VDRLTAALAGASGLVIVDPNPRPRLIADVAAYREGAEKTLETASLVKLSDEDVAVLYHGDQEAATARVFGRGVTTLLLTHGSAGASLRTRSGITVSVGIARSARPLIDTMGAGDATLATVIAFVLRHGLPQDATAWRRCLDDAMRVAAETCAHAGGGLRLPQQSLLSMPRAGP